jgi:dTDP-4-dehydrorhamnose reductase
MRKTVLVTGANGQLALTIKDRYSQNIDDIDFVFLTKKQFDISNKSQIETQIAQHDFSVCINCAAYTNVEMSEEDPKTAYSINAKGLKNLAECCKKHDIDLIHISTDYVFDGNNNTPYQINDDTNPINEYGKSKLQGEQFLQEELSNFHIIRSSWLYSLYGTNFLKTIIRKIEASEEMNIISTQTGTPTSCNGLADFIYFIITNQLTYGIYHYTALDDTNWYLFAQQIASHYPNYDQSKLQPLDHFHTKARRPKYSVLNLDKTLKVFPNIKHWKDEVNETILKLKAIS